MAVLCRNQRLWTDTAGTSLRAIVENNRKDIEVVRYQRSRPGSDQCASAAVRFRARTLSREVTVASDSISVAMARSRSRREGSGAAALEGARGRDRARMPGLFTSKEKAVAHLTAGADRVLISAPADGVDLTVVFGVNHDKLARTTGSSPTPPAHQLPRARRQGAQ